MPESFTALKAQAQQALIEFLNTDLSLAFTFLETARIEAEHDADHSRAALGKSRAALVSIRRFQGRIEGRAEWERIQDRANELEAALNAFSD